MQYRYCLSEITIVRYIAEEENLQNKKKKIILINNIEFFISKY